MAAFVAECARTATSEEAIEQAEKIGHDTGLRCRNPLVPEQELPIYVANFVLMDYGTGAIFGCPRTISAIWSLRASTAFRSCRWCCPRARTRSVSRSATRPTSAMALDQFRFLNGLDVAAANSA